MKVLLIDDDSMMLTMYERLLKLENFEVEIAHDGQEGLDSLKESAKTSKLPKLILLDIMMPRMDGYEFLKIVRNESTFKNIPIVVLTNLYSREDREKSLELKADDYIVKSESDPKEVVVKIKQHIK